VPDVHARDLRRALERRAVGFDGQRGSDLVKLSLERPGEVANLEVDPRMNRVEVPGTRRGSGENRRVHWFCSSFHRFFRMDILASASTLPIGCCLCKYLQNLTSLVFSIGSWL